MLFNPEVQLVLLAVALYLFDSSCLLRADEGVLTQSRDGWKAAPGLDEFLLGGRAWCLLSPITPHRPAYRLSWDLAGPGSSRPAHDWPPPGRPFQRLAPFTLAAGVALFVLLPIGLFAYRSIGLLLLTAAVIYGGIAIALALLYPQRAQVGKTGLRFAGLAFECLLCPPLGVNLVRRVTLAQPVPEDFLTAVDRLLPPEARAVARQRCARRIDDVLADGSLEPARAAALAAHQARLAGTNAAAPGTTDG